MEYRSLLMEKKRESFHSEYDSFVRIQSSFDEM